jgi:hypothetical protein
VQIPASKGRFLLPFSPFQGEIERGFPTSGNPSLPSPEREGNSKVEILQGLHPRRAVQKDIPPMKGEEIKK